MKGKTAYYKDDGGIVTDVMGNIAIIKLFKDDSEYTVDIKDLVADDSCYKCTIKKDAGYLDQLARELFAAGVTSLTVKDGEVKKVVSIETLDEKIDRYKLEAEEKARKEYEKEQSK